MTAMVLSRASILLPPESIPPPGVGMLRLTALDGVQVLKHVIDIRRPDSMILSQNEISQVLTGLLVRHSFDPQERVNVVTDSTTLHGTYTVTFPEAPVITGDVYAMSSTRGLLLKPAACGCASGAPKHLCGCGLLDGAPPVEPVGVDIPMVPIAPALPVVVTGTVPQPAVHYSPVVDVVPVLAPSFTVFGKPGSSNVRGPMPQQTGPAHHKEDEKAPDHNHTGTISLKEMTDNRHTSEAEKNPNHETRPRLGAMPSSAKKP